MIAIIPARGGSKGVPRKNIKDLGGKPLIYWTIEAASAATNIDKIIISTDDEEIAEICRCKAVEIPFMRPKELAQDNSLAIDNYLYTMNRLIKEYNYLKKEFTVLLPTVPFRNANDIDSCIDLYYAKQADSVISCTPLSHPASWICNISQNGTILHKGNEKNSTIANRQELQQGYIPNGGVYVLQLSLLQRTYSYYSDKTFAHIMPPERSIDIDTEFDFEFAKYMVSKNGNYF